MSHSEPNKPKQRSRALSADHQKFCMIYATDYECFGNGVQAYMAVYPMCKPGAAAASASRLLKNVNILKRVDELLDLYLTNQFVDKELAFVIHQKADLSSKVAAIREYNRLKDRVREGESGNKTFNLTEILVQIQQTGEADHAKYEPEMALPSNP